MAEILPSTCLTLADHAARHESGNVADIVELLSQNNEILDDMLWREGNQPTGHKTTVRTGLPAATWRRYNMGVPRGKSTTAQITDTCGMLETYSQIDRDLANLDGNSAAFRLSEDAAFLEGMSQQMATTLFYGSEQANDAAFTGIMPRFNTLDPRVAASAVNVIDGGGRGSENTSIILACWGPTNGFGIFPKGSTAGLRSEDVTTNAPVYDDEGRPFQAYQTHYKWDCGLVIRDWRYFARIANVDVSSLNGANAANLINLMTVATKKPPTIPRSAGPVQVNSNGGNSPINSRLSFGRPAFYLNRTAYTALELQAQNKSNVLLTLNEFDGMTVMKFKGIPIRTCDAIIDTEAAIMPPS